MERRQRRNRRKKLVAWMVTVLTLCAAGGAIAYWTAGGSGSGSADAGDVVAITVVQGAAPTGLYPGGTASTLSGTFTNPNDGPVYVNDVTASLVSVTDGFTDAAKPECTTADFQLPTATISIDADVAADDSTTWTGITVGLKNTALNQDNCKNATIVLAYTSN